MQVLVIAPWMDIVTAISAELGLKFAEWAKNRGHSVKVLLGWEATRIPLLLSLISGADFVYYCGHGTVDSLVGNEVFWDLVTPFNAGWLSERVTAVMACLSAANLGKVVVAEGGYTYVGAYDILYAAFREEHDYLSDWLDYMLRLPQGIVEDKPFGVALNDLQLKAVEYSNFYEAEKPDASWDWYANTALHNSKVYTVIGDSSLRLSDLIKMKEERIVYPFFEGVTQLFKPDTLRSQWDEAWRGLLGFGVTAGLAVGVVVPPVVDAVAEYYGVPKPFAEAAKKIATGAAVVSPY